MTSSKRSATSAGRNWWKSHHILPKYLAIELEPIRAPYKATYRSESMDIEPHFCTIML
jgi:hypothetical protein